MQTDQACTQPRLGHIGVAVLLLLLTTNAIGGGTAMGVRHPVYDYGIDKAKAAQYEKAVARVMALSNADLLAFVPEHGYASFCECPNCYGGVEGNGIFKWSIERPDELTCRFCGEVVVPNPKYPETKLLTGKNGFGEDIALPYYLNESKDIPHFFSMHLLRYKRQWLLDQCRALGVAYQATAKEEYAKRVVLVLDRWAQVYLHYPALHNRSCRNIKFCKSQEPPYSWDAGRWGYFHNEVPKKVIAAYDLVCESPEFDTLSAQRGYDVREKLENDFFRKTYDVVAVNAYHVSNVVGYDVAGVAILGRVINDPSYVHRALGWMMRNLDEGFFVDGNWHEAPSYHYMTIGGLKQAFRTLKGHSDPPGYLDPVDGTRFDDLDPENDIPFWGKVQHAPSVLDFPNGCSTPVHDTWPGERRSPPREQTQSTIAPAYGHASLGRGRGTNQMQAQLHFSGAYGHSHLDNLNLTLFAKGSEMAPDLGYTWTQMRYWCTSTLGHNTVVVDRTDQTSGNTDGDLLWFFPDTNGVSVVEADGKRGYRTKKGLDLYRRMLVMVPVSDDDAYVVDVFRVRGGAVHDWALHGDADQDTTATCSLPLSAKQEWMLEPGEEWKEPTITGARFNPYGLIRDVRKADVHGTFSVEFAYAEDSAGGMRLHMAACGPGPAQTTPSVEAWLGRAPSVRRMGTGTNGDMRKVYDFWMPQLVVRHRGTAPLTTTFAAIEEPHGGKPFIAGVERVPLDPPDAHAVALRIVHDAGTDTIISTLDAPPYVKRTTPDGVALRGRLGIARQGPGTTAAAWLFEGTELSVGDWGLTAEKTHHEGTIVAAMRKSEGAEVDAFIVDADIPHGKTLRDTWMIVTHGNGFTHGYRIERVQTTDARTLVVLTDDHGLKIDGDTTTELYFPRRSIKGRNTFTIPLAVSSVVAE